MLHRLYCVALISITLIAFGLRSLRLDHRPMHPDEGNQAVRCGILIDTGVYRYDPTDHHGPTLYYLTLPLAWGTTRGSFSLTNEYTFRMVPVLFGTGLILLLLLVQPWLGKPTILFSALLLAVSPAMVYYSRFYMQEMLLVFFSFGAIAAGWRYIQESSLKWALLAGMFLGLMFATKETAVISHVAMLLAVLLTRAGRRSNFGESRLKRSHLLAGLAAAIVVSAAFFSSFFSNRAGPLDSFRSYSTYMQKANGATLHAHPWYYYLQLLTWFRYRSSFVWSEGLIVGFAGFGALTAWFGENRGEPGRTLLRFLALYTAMLVAAYSSIAHKTPWCVLSFLQPMILLAGLGITVLLRCLRRLPIAIIAGILIAAGICHLGWQAWQANFRYDADPRNPYAYAQTSRDLLNLLQRVEEIAAIHPGGQEMLIAVIATPANTWPLPWYLRRYSSVGYWADASDFPSKASPAIVITTVDHDEKIAQRFGEGFQVEFYGLRPGVLLLLHIRRDLWNEFIKTRISAQSP